MIELIFVACLSASPSACEKRSLTYVDVSPMACMVAAQPELAKWVEGHPRWRVNSWKCQMVRKGRDI